MNSTGRILAIDPGGRRMGLAVSDELGITAQGLETFDVKAGDFMAHLSCLIKDYSICRVVVGYPISMSGRPNETSEKSRSLAITIRDRFDIQVSLWDERLTSAEARRTLSGRKPDKKTVDKIAAILILQGFMESGGNGGIDPV